MIQRRVGELPLRFFQAESIGHLVEVSETERACDTSGDLVFGFPKLAREISDLQVGLSESLLTAYDVQDTLPKFMVVSLYSPLLFGFRKVGDRMARAIPDRECNAR